MDVEVLSADRSFLDMLRPLLQDLNFPSRPPDVDATSVWQTSEASDLKGGRQGSGRRTELYVLHIDTQAC